MPADAPTAAAGFGRLVRTERRKAGLTQDDLAARAGIGQSTLSSYESGVVEPSLRNAALVATALQLSLDDLGAPFLLAPRRLSQVPA